jgi:chromate reductase, NAD(P)H dehydrogenase (quinone)
MTKILAFAGSERKESFNRRLVKIAAAGAERAGAQVTVIDLADYPMPLFNQDIEAESGIPQHARLFKQLLIDHDGFLIASPEYNSAFSPLLKNAIDWASRSEKSDEPPLVAYKGKMAVVMATSPGNLGGLRGLVFVRMLLANLGILVLPNQIAVANAHQAFDDEGLLIDKNQQAAVTELGAILFKTIAK